MPAQKYWSCWGYSLLPIGKDAELLGVPQTFASQDVRFKYLATSETCEDHLDRFRIVHATL